MTGDLARLPATVARRAAGIIGQDIAPPLTARLTGNEDSALLIRK